MNILKPYTAYKPSGIAWLGDIPEHWHFSSIRWLAQVYSGGTPSRDIIRYWENGTIPWLSSGEVNRRRIDYANTFITQEALDNSSAKWIPAQSIIIALAGQGKTKGKIATIEKEMTCNQSLGVIVPNRLHCNYEYLAYYLDSKYKQIRGLVGDNLRDGLNLEHIKSIIIPLCSLPEQTAIVNFLDYKTSKIDRFISKKKQLIKLLNEQKAAIINEAVTKGLVPNVEMKASGIEWLGDIPKHWEVRKLKGILAKEKGALKPGPFGSDLKNTDIIPTGYKVYNQRAVLDSDFEISEECISPSKFEDLKVFEVCAGDILLTTRGTIGRCCIIPNDFEKGIIHPCIIRLRVDVNMVKLQFVKLFIEQANAFKIALKVNSNATTIDVIYGNTLRDIFFIIPPLTEQAAIVAHIEQETAIINRTIATIEQEIALVQEYRTALIAEAVTGKIDVRGYEVPTIEEAEEEMMLEEGEELLEMEEDGEVIINE